MKVRYHKAVSVYTHPAITDYEFNRMKKVERTYIISCMAAFTIMMFSFPCILISSAKEAKHDPVSVEQPSKPSIKPAPEVEGEYTYDTTKFDIKVDVGSTTIDTR
jgi:hypothetical protein